MWTAGVMDAMVVGTMAASMSSTQSNDDFIMGIALSLGVVVMVHTFSLSFVPLFLISCMPLLVVKFTPQSSNNTVVGLGDVGWQLMVGGRDSGVLLAKLLGTVCTSFVTCSLVPLTLFTPLSASIWVLATGMWFVHDIVVVVVEWGGLAFVVVKCKQSIDCDIMMMSFVSSRASATCLSPSFLALLSSLSSLSFSLSSPFPSFSLFILSLVAL